MSLIFLIYVIGMAQTLYFFLLLAVPLNEVVRKLVMRLLFHSDFSKQLKQASLYFIGVVFLLCLHSINETYTYKDFLKQEVQEEDGHHHHHHQEKMHSIEMQTRVNYNKSVKQFHLTFYILVVNICVFGYTLYLKKLDDLQLSIEKAKAEKITVEKKAD